MALSISYVWDRSRRGAHSNGDPGSKCRRTEQVPLYAPPTNNHLWDLDHFFSFANRRDFSTNHWEGSPLRRAHLGHGQKRWMCVAFINCVTSVPTTFEICFNLQNRPFSALLFKKCCHRHLRLTTSLPATISSFFIFTVLIGTSAKITQPLSHGARTKALVSAPPPTTQQSPTSMQHSPHPPSTSLSSPWRPPCCFLSRWIWLP